MRHHHLDFDEQVISLDGVQTGKRIAEFDCGSTVPILLDGDIKIWDSMAILEYLAERHPGCCGWPENALARAHARSVSAEMHSGFSGIRTTMPMNCRRRLDDFPVSPEVQREIFRINAIFNDCRQRYHHEGSWLFGEYSIADSMFAPVVMRFNTYAVNLDGEGADYMETVNSQSAVLDLSLIHI